MKKSIFFAGILFLLMTQSVRAMGFGDIMGDQKGEVLGQKRATKEAQIREDIQLRQEERKEAIITKAAEKREEIRERFTERKRLSIEKYFNKMVKKIEKALERLANVSQRIANQLAKMESKGLETADLKTKLTAADTLRTEAQNALNDAKTKLNEILENVLDKSNFSQVKDLIKQVSAKIKLSHRAYQEIVREIAKRYNFGFGPKGTISPKPTQLITPTAGVSITPTHTSGAIATLTPSPTVTTAPEL